MIHYVRSFFGFSSVGRKVIGGHVNFEMKDVEFIRNSNSRLTALQSLIKRFKNTPSEPKIQLVFEKTKNIHHYLVNKKRIRELELFHIQNTDHFINTFNVIMDVHKSPKESFGSPPRPEIIDIVNKKRESNRSGANAPGKNEPVTVRTFSSSEKVHVTENITTEKPSLQVPDISLHTLSKITYKRKGVNNSIIDKEIGFFSTKEDKETFLSEVASRLNLPVEDIAYVGNAMVNIPDHNNRYKQLEYVPIIHWKGFMYALNLNDYRLFPVTMQRKNR